MATSTEEWIIVVPKQLAVSIRRAAADADRTPEAQALHLLREVDRSVHATELNLDIRYWEPGKGARVITVYGDAEAVPRLLQVLGAAASDAEPPEAQALE